VSVYLRQIKHGRRNRAMVLRGKTGIEGEKEREKKIHEKSNNQGDEQGRGPRTTWVSLKKAPNNTCGITCRESRGKRRSNQI